MLETIDLFRLRILKSYVGYDGIIRLDPKNALHPFGWYHQLLDFETKRQKLFYLERNGSTLLVRSVSVVRGQYGLYISHKTKQDFQEEPQEQKVAHVDDEHGEYGYGGDWWKAS